MCLPYNFLKAFLVPSTWCLMLLSLPPIVMMVVFHNEGELYINYTEALIIGGIESGCIFLIGLFGFLGYIFKQRCILCCYFTSLTGLTLILIGLIIYYQVMYSYVKSNANCDSQVPNIVQYQNLTYEASLTLCQDACLCYIENGIFSSAYLYQNNLVWTNNEDITNVTQFQQCSTTYNSYEANLLEYLENTYKCAGWCDPSPIYLFSDVNNGEPNQNATCYTYFRETLLAYYNKGEFILFAIILFTASILVLTCCYCYHPNNPRQWQQSQIYKHIQYKYTL